MGVLCENFSAKNNLSNTAHAYQCVDSELALKLFLKKLISQSSVCFDTETTSLNSLKAELVGIAFSWENNKGYYLPFSENQNAAQELIEKIQDGTKFSRFEHARHTSLWKSVVHVPSKFADWSA